MAGASGAPRGLPVLCGCNDLAETNEIEPDLQNCMRGHRMLGHPTACAGSRRSSHIHNRQRNRTS